MLVFQLLKLNCFGLCGFSLDDYKIRPYLLYIGVYKIYHGITENASYTYRYIKP